MKLVKPSVTQITETDPFRKIEIVGRTCYKSSSAMTDETAKKFFSQLVNRHHYAMVEHATFVFLINKDKNDINPRITIPMINYLGTSYCQYNNAGVIETTHGFLHITETSKRILISGNLRAIIESGSELLTRALYSYNKDLVYSRDYIPYYVREELDTYNFTPTDCFGRTVCVLPDISTLSDITKEEFMAHFYMTLHFITDRGVTHEMVRHRPMSFAQESTRYCNYSKDQFGHEISCITPAHFDEWDETTQWHFITTLEEAEAGYFALLEQDNRTPQEARAVLPTTLKTEIICTANAKEWNHFFNLRSRGITGAPHPDMKVVADMALNIFEPIETKYLGKCCC